MPNVTAPVRLMQSGEAITQFIDTASTTSTTFTYPNQQEGLNFINKGVAAITLTVNNVGYTIQPGQNQSISAVFTAITVQSASGTQQFDATSWSYEKDDLQLAGNNVKKDGSIKIQAPIDLLQKDLVKISCFGDSITAGSFNIPRGSYWWYPTKLNHMLAQNALKTIKTGSNLWAEPATNPALAGTTVVAGEYTLTTSGTEANPRFIGNYQTLTKGELYLATAEIDASSVGGYQLALRYAAATNIGALLSPDYKAIGFDISMGGYRKVCAVISTDKILTDYPTATYFAIGGMLIGTSASVLSGKIRNLELYKLSKGTAIVNQGVSGEQADAGLARINQITAWNPDAVIVGYGTNDLRNGVALSTYKDNLEQIIIKLQECGALPILATITPLASDQSNYSQVGKWNDSIKELADYLRIPVWDRYLAFQNGNLKYLEDGRHPTKDGYHILANSVMQMLIGNASN